MRQSSQVEVVLYAHGSRDPRWRATFEELADAVGAEAGAGVVRLAYLELTCPTLEEVVEQAARAGTRRLRVLPMFLAAGKHVSDDVRARVEDARASHPELEIELLPAVGEDERVRSLLRQIARESSAPDAAHE